VLAVVVVVDDVDGDEEKEGAGLGCLPQESDLIAILYYETNG